MPEILGLSAFLSVIMEGMKKKVFVIMVLAAVLWGLSAYAGEQYVIPISESEFYSDTYALYSLLGLASPSYSQPWTGSEASIILSRAEEAAGDDESASALLCSLETRLEGFAPSSSLSDGFSYDLSVDASPEIYVHTNTEDYVNDTDWFYNFDNREKLLTLKIELGVNDFFYTYSELALTKSRYSWDGTELYSHETDFPYGIGAIVDSYENVKKKYMEENGITDESDLPSDWKQEYRYSPHVVKSSTAYSSVYNDNTPFWSFWNVAANFPTRAIVSFGGDNWNLLFGRDRLNWGRSIIGSFIIDKHVSYHDFARLSIYTDSFKYEWNNLFLETQPYVSEVDKKGPDGIRIYMNHRLEFRPAEWLSFVLTEGLMYSSKVLELQNLNPAFIYHQLNNRDLFNSIASMELYVTPLRGWDIYWQFGLDNGTIPGEGNSQANALGMLLGSSYSLSLTKGYLSVTAEGAFTTPMMYRRDGVDFLMLQRDYTFIYLGSGTVKLNYIGFPYGSDATVGKIQLEYNIPEVLYTTFASELIRKGEINMFHSHNIDNDNNEKANITGSTPYGDVITYQLTLSLEAKYCVPELVSWADMSVFGNVAYIMRWTHTKSTGETTSPKNDLQFSLGFSFEV